MHFSRAMASEASPHGLDAVLVGLDEEVLPALPRHVHPAAVVVDDAGVQSRPAHAGLLRVKKRSVAQITMNLQAELEGLSALGYEKAFSVASDQLMTALQKPRLHLDLQTHHFIVHRPDDSRWRIQAAGRTLVSAEESKKTPVRLGVNSIFFSTPL